VRGETTISGSNGTSAKLLVIDVECSGATNGTKANPFTPANRMCCYGYGYVGSDSRVVRPVQYEEEAPYGEAISELQARIDEADLIITATKFDLHWLQRYGVRFQHKAYYDIQQVEFILNAQRVALPSVDYMCEKYGLELKKEVVREEYWKKGLDTDMVPWPILAEYQDWDVRQEALIFQKQIEQLNQSPKMKRLAWNSCQDELMTQQMEWNGIRYDVNLSLKIANDLESESVSIDKSLYELFPFTWLNWGSPLQVSAVLYGGQVAYDVQESFEFVYANPKKPPVMKKKWVTKYHEFPRLVTPLDKSKLAKEGQWSTNDKTLSSLKPTGKAKQAIALLLKRRGIEKRIGTWYRGFPEKIQEMQWEDNLLHSQLNHSVAGTGRLASSGPNVQNIEDKVRQCQTTRFPITNAKRSSFVSDNSKSVITT
jgi:DNA polymerase I-like protein with 3'-5' exonuclease and polymerase domains